MMPVRIQRRRSKGWKMPAGVIYAGRPSKHGNPFAVGGYYKIGRGAGTGGFSWVTCDPNYRTPDFTLIETPAMAVEWYRRYRELYPLTEQAKEELRGRDISCWCRLDQPCHVDVLLELANAPIDPTRSL
jgi:hypothetical protein